MRRPTPRPDSTRRLGVWMIAATWLVLLAIASIAFDDWLIEQVNPNRRTETRVHVDGIREVVLAQNRQGHYVATGTIDDTEVVFLLDTGATDVSVPLAVAQRLGLRSGAPMQAMTASDVITTYAVVLDRVTIGNITRRRVRASVNPRAPNDEVLLGMSFLRHIELIQRDRTLTLRQYPDRE